MTKLTLVAGVFFIAGPSYSQESRWALQKEGKWQFENNLPEKAYHLRNAVMREEDNRAFKNNVTNLAAWWKQNHPMLKDPKGYDMHAFATWVWGDFTTKSETEYGIPASLSFLFELFLSDGGKWTVEPPHYELTINATYGGHDGWYFTPEANVEQDEMPDAKHQAILKAQQRLTEYFPAFPLKEQPWPGVNVYETYPGGPQQIVVFNPERPPFWILATVREVADASLAYYSLFQEKEIDKMLLEQLKKEIAELSPEELDAPACAGHNTHFVLKVNGSQEGLQIMRFNPAYWNRNLPVWAIQFMTYWNASHTREEMEEQQRNTYPDYPQLFVNRIKWNEVAELIQKK